MKSVLKYAVAASALGVLAIALSLPSDAQTRRRAAATIAPLSGPGMTAREYAYDYAPAYYPFWGPFAAAEPAPSGFEAYAYSPGFYGDAGMSCVTQGGYGKQFDYAGCY